MGKELKIIRKILILTLNSQWGSDLKEKFLESPKATVDVVGSRSIATKLLTHNEYLAVIIEDTFKLKNMDYFLRTVLSQTMRPDFVFFCFSDFDLYRTITVPEELRAITFRAYSLPMPMSTLQELVFKDIFPYGSSITGQFDREFISILMRSTKRVFNSFNLDFVNMQKPELLTKMEDLNVAVRGKIIIKSKYFKGSFLISFPERAYEALYRKVVGAVEGDDTVLSNDFAGELANMIYGQAKKELDENGVKLEMAIPIVDQSSEIKSDSAIFVVPIQSSIGLFYLKLAPGYFS